MSIILRTAVGKGSFKAITALGSRQGTINLGSALLCLNIYRREDSIVATHDTAGQIILQIADGHSTAKAHIGVGSAAFYARKPPSNLEVSAGGLIGNRSPHNVIVQHKGLNVLLGPIIIHHASAVDIRTGPISGADPHASRHFNAKLGSRVGNHEGHRQI